MYLSIQGPPDSAIRHIVFSNNAPVQVVPGIEPTLDLLVCKKTHAEKVTSGHCQNYNSFVLELFQLAIKENGFHIHTQDGADYYLLKFGPTEALHQVVALIDAIHGNSIVAESIVALNPCREIADSLSAIKHRISDHLRPAVAQFQKDWLLRFFSQRLKGVVPYHSVASQKSLKKAVPSHSVPIQKIYLVVDELENKLRTLAEKLEIELYDHVNIAVHETAVSIGKVALMHTFSCREKRLLKDIYSVLRDLTAKTYKVFNICERHTALRLNSLDPDCVQASESNSDTENKRINPNRN